MALTKTVNIDGKDVTFRASAAIPRIYRNRFHRDIYKDLEWLDQFGTFSIYQVLSEIIELWGLNVQTQVESKKNFDRLTGK